MEYCEMSAIDCQLDSTQVGLKYFHPQRGVPLYGEETWATAMCDLEYLEGKFNAKRDMISDAPGTLILGPASRLGTA